VKLGQFLADAPEAPRKDVSFKVLGRAKGDGSKTMIEASACFMFVDQASESKAFADADEALASSFSTSKIAPPADVRAAKRNFYLLHAALRDKDDPRQPFAESADMLERALSPRQAVFLLRAYDEFVAEEFPDTITAQGLAALESEAEKKS
jgi:hypothetical protein